ncbi:LysM peptidoglycan-binding domain-containing protein [Planctobacterium marinum]|uniref:Lytic transglycosylase n=1 Tax=Planctobacterium marinum TaxID=1631968 RepID=A0AA48KNX4_9ALTE|nr:lytic transglycosylase [Planctobacterium marinum]
MTDRIFLPLVIAFALQGCQLTQPLTEDKTSSDDFIAAEYIDECYIPPDVADLAFECDENSEGTHEVIHPVSELDELISSVPEMEQITEQGTVEQEDLWQLVRSELTMPIPDNKRIWNQQAWYRKHPHYMQRVNKRAAPFFKHIVEKLKAADMPMELALLPIVESAFDPFAYSHGRAAGMWQFIPGTAERFGIKQTWWFDGRRDVISSTDGAIKYLQYLYKFFDGNWLHALAAYNSGEGRVRNAIKHNRRNGKPTDFWNLDLPRETRAYVPKLLALSDLLMRSEELGFDWPTLKNEDVTEVVEIGSQIDLAMAADWAGLTVEQLHSLNPGFNRWATDPNGPHRLLLPIDKVAQFEVALGDKSERQRLNWVRHKIKSGESLLKLANKYHTSVDVIQQVNELRGNVIRAGDYLMIPVALKSLDYYSLSEEQRLLAKQSKKRGTHQLKHTVKSGDTLWDISREYNVNLRSLAKWNGMAPTDPLKPGKELVIWVNQVSEIQSDNAVMRTVTYTVRKGDSLARIANKFNVAINDLTKWNQLNKKKYLQPGQKLKIYVDVTRT